MSLGKWAGWVVVCGVFLAACAGGGGGDVAPPVLADEDPAATAEADVEATATAATVEDGATAAAVEDVEGVAVDDTYEPTDQERIDAALMQLEADGLEGIVAWDVLDARVSVDGLVRIEVCGWSGDSVFDQVLESRWQTSVDGGELLVAERGYNVAQGDCLNTELIESALEFTKEYDEFYTAVLAEPITFISRRSEAEALMTNTEASVVAAAMAQLTEDGVVGITSYAEPGLGSGSIAPVQAARRADDAGPSSLELVGCRAMNARTGLYRSGVLIESSRPEEEGPHLLSFYSLVRSEQSWLLSGLEQLAWGDCLAGSGDWVGNVTSWWPDRDWETVE